MSKGADTLSDNVVEITFDSLLELEYLDLLEKSVKNKPDSIHAESIIYDEHHVLLVAAYIARDFLRIIHFPEKLEGEKEEHTLIHTAFWMELIQENVITPRYPGFADGGRTRTEPDDAYLTELLSEVEFKGFVHPNDYPLLTHIEGNPYVPSWHALKWSRKAMRTLQSRIREKGGEDSDV